MWEIGDNNINSKLTDEDVISMRVMFDLKYQKQKEIIELEDLIEEKKKEIGGLSLKAIAYKFGVALGTASRIKNRETWSHI